MTPEEVLQQALGIPPPNPGSSLDDGINPFSMPPQAAPMGGFQQPPLAPPTSGMNQPNPLMGMDPMALIQALKPVRVRPGMPSKKDLDKIEQYARDAWQESTDYVKKKVYLWQLWDALHDDLITQRQWQEWRQNGSRLSTSLSRRDISELLPDGEDDVPADYVHGPGYLVRSFVHNAYPVLFEGPQYITVISPGTKAANQAPEPTEQPSFGLDQRVQRLMEEKLEAGGFHARVKQCLGAGPKLGTVIAKASWYQERIPVEYINPLTEKSEIKLETVNQYPIIEMIPLERAIVDPQARHSDCQRWRWVGNWVEKTYDQCLAGWEGDNSLYNVNKTEFVRRFKDGQTVTSSDEEISPDTDRDNDSPTDGYVRIGELHIRVPLSYGLAECVVKLATEAGSDSCKDALLIGVLMGPVLFDLARRPYATWQYDDKESVYGTGVIQAEESRLFLLSKFMGQGQENARRTAILTSLVTPELKDYLDLHHGGKLPYQALLPLLDGMNPASAIASAYPLPQFPAQYVSEQIALLKNTLERSATAVDAPVAGSQKNDQTATGMGILQQQGQAPLRTHLRDFCHDLLNPLLTCALELCRQNLTGNQEITLQDSSGADVIAEISQEELQNGKFKIQAAITKQDALNNVQAQILKDLLRDVLPAIEPKLLEEGIRPLYGVFLRRIMDLLRLEQGDKALHQFSTYEQQQIQQLQQLFMENEQLKQALASVPQPAASNGNGSGKAPSPKLPGESGGPMGTVPSDPNTLALQMQMAQEPNMGYGG